MYIYIYICVYIYIYIYIYIQAHQAQQTSARRPPPLYTLLQPAEWRAAQPALSLSLSLLLSTEVDQSTNPSINHAHMRILNCF